jgi:hypothetical protein
MDIWECRIVRRVGAGLVVVGAALGFGMLASGALDGMALQPESERWTLNSDDYCCCSYRRFQLFALVVTFMLETKGKRSSCAC